MDERERKGADQRRTGKGNPRRRRPDIYAHGPSGSSSGQRRSGRTGKRSSRARRRRRNAAIRWTIFILLILAAIGGFLIWTRYGASNEKADLEQYYELDQEDEVAVVVDNEVVRDDADTSADDTEAAHAPGKIYDGQYYIEYSVVRDGLINVFTGFK